ncbi:L-rhamnose mutarotase [Andreprevotia chitinilytica]|uniref:L-rhamnose mutarotase n=1 Tax=Andreprevotia chitinilytica TaxID=396808 RepID=UPI0005552835|nr:L-rhamnose mutarotase [Andreprevotia chitinilytica]
MQTHAFRMTLNPGMQDEYKRRHDAIWPELADTLHAAGIADYWIFLDEETHHLFAVLKAADDHSMDELPLQAIVRKWWLHMADIMATQPDSAPQQVALKPMFHLA